MATRRDGIKFYEPNLFDIPSGDTVEVVRGDTKLRDVNRLISAKNNEDVTTERRTDEIVISTKIDGVTTPDPIIPDPIIPDPIVRQTTEAQATLTAEFEIIDNFMYTHGLTTFNHGKSLIGGIARGGARSITGLPASSGFWTANTLRPSYPFIPSDPNSPRTTAGRNKNQKIELILQHLLGMALVTNHLPSQEDSVLTFQLSPSTLYRHLVGMTAYSLRFDESITVPIKNRDGTTSDTRIGIGSNVAPTDERTSIVIGNFPSGGIKTGFEILPEEIRNLPSGTVIELGLNFFFDESRDSLSIGQLLSTTTLSEIQPPIIQPPPIQPPPIQLPDVIERRSLNTDTIIVRGQKSFRTDIKLLGGEGVFEPSDLSIFIGSLPSPADETLKVTLELKENFTVDYGGSIGEVAHRRCLVGGFLRTADRTTPALWTQETIDGDYSSLTQAQQNKISGLVTNNVQMLTGILIVENHIDNGRGGTFDSSVLIGSFGSNIAYFAIEMITIIEPNKLRRSFEIPMRPSSSRFVPSSRSRLNGRATQALRMGSSTDADARFGFSDLPSWITEKEFNEPFDVAINFEFGSADSLIRGDLLSETRPPGFVPEILQPDRMAMPDPQIINGTPANTAGITYRETPVLSSNFTTQRGFLVISFDGQIYTPLGPAGTRQPSPVRMNNYAIPTFFTDSVGDAIECHIGYENYALLMSQGHLELNFNFKYRIGKANYMFVGEDTIEAPAIEPEASVNVIPESVEIGNPGFGGGPNVWVVADGFRAIETMEGETVETNSPSSSTSSVVGGIIRIGNLNSDSSDLERKLDTIAIELGTPTNITEVRISGAEVNFRPMQIKEFIATRRIGELKGYPGVRQFPFTQNETTVAAKDGRFFINKQRSTIKRVDLTGKNYTIIEDVELLEELHNRDFPFLVWFNGGHENFRFEIPGFRQSDIFKVQTRADFRVSLTKSSYRGLINFRISLVESI